MKKKTLVNILLDRSGSMGVIKEATVKAINTLIREQQQLPGEVTFSLYQFDDPHNAACKGEDFPQVVFQDMTDPNYTEKEYVPRGNTALTDAACKTIDYVGTKLRNTPEHERPDGVAFVIITDGLDNHSGNPKSELKKRIEHQRDKYGWKFHYMGAGHDAIAEGHTFGLQACDTQTYEATAGGITKGVIGASATLGAYRGN